MPDYAQRLLPEAGAWRVHPQPEALPRLAHDGPGLNRYDDPLGRAVVRYVAVDPVDGLQDWISVQRVGRVRLAEHGQLLAVYDPALLRDLDKHPLVRSALESVLP